MTTSNTELAAQARQHAETCDRENMRFLGDWLRQLADALESKAEPVATVESAAPGAGGFHCKLAAGAPMPLVGMQLYTAPVQPEKDERKPLTKAQRARAYAASVDLMEKDHSLAWRDAIVQAVEAAHGIGSSTEEHPHE